MPDQTDQSARAAESARPSFAGPQKRRAGETIPGTMRRIGERHAVVTRAITAELVDIGSLENQLATTNVQLEKARRLVSTLEAQRAQLETRIAQFQAAPVERIDGDPTPNVNEPDEPEHVPPADAGAPSPTPAPGKRG